LLTELFGDFCGADALLQQVENLRAYGIEAKHRSTAEVEHDGTVGARCSSHVICGAVSLISFPWPGLLGACHLHALEATDLFPLFANALRACDSLRM